MNLARLRNLKDRQTLTSDENFKYLMNALFTPVDMTDHEETFVGWDEVPGVLPIQDATRLTMEVMDEPLPQSNALAGMSPVEGRKYYGTSPTW